ncbi:MAG: protein jag [Verrucomicrobiales bacterium]
MSEIAEAQKITETILGKLGFEVEVTPDPEDDKVLDINSPDNRLLIGKNGDRLDDLQYLVNRILRKSHPDAERIRLDCEGYRLKKEEQVQNKARNLADKVRESGQELWMRPMNSYERRLVHNALVDDPEIESISEDTHKRMKKILLRLK